MNKGSVPFISRSCIARHLPEIYAVGAAEIS